MVAIPGLTANYLGKASFIGPRLLLGSQTSRLMRREMEPVLFSSFQCSRRKLWCLSSIYLRGRHAVLAAGSSSYGSSSKSDLSPEEPFWLALVKELIWSLKSLLSFLREQPNQLKYIEWPGFQSTLKTAILTLILVALLMVALTSVDIVLFYISRLLLLGKSS
ncbi:hypothetical protein SAY87_020861 [Trapa incisa]|uniref:Uncharacterized protein n=1 Tax=Trapa incisa TaxID=236973 RepID=A0AAN7JWC6_9MYRT|nr:hypothetical protein SAY87_020861 [Trapa incisa]